METYPKTIYFKTEKERDDFKMPDAPIVVEEPAKTVDKKKKK